MSNQSINEPPAGPSTYIGVIATVSALVIFFGTVLVCINDSTAKTIGFWLLISGFIAFVPSCIWLVKKTREIAENV